MILFTQLTGWMTSHLIIALSVSTLAAVALGVALKRRSSKREAPGQEDGSRRKFSAGTIAAAAAFVICTSVSLNTSYRFTGDPDGLNMTDTAERLLACAAFESLMAMCVLGARERMADDETRSGGWYGSAVWVFAALSAIPAYEEGEGFTTATMVRIIVGSFGSALAAHSALGLELRHRTGAESQTAMAQIARDLRERLMARLGLAHRSRSAEEIARDRAMDKAVDLYDRYTRLTDEEQTTRKGARIAKRLAMWQDRAGIGTDPEQRELYRRRAAHRTYATRLIVADDESPWNQPTTAQVQASALGRLTAHTEHLEEVANEAEASLRAQIAGLGTHPAAHAGTAGPRPCAEPVPDDDEEPAECVDSQEEAQAAESYKTAAAHRSTNKAVTARVTQDEGHNASGDEDERPLLRDLKSYPTKRAALEALYHDRIASDDPRSTNAIAEELLKELADAGRPLDRGAANRYIGALRPTAEGQDNQDEAATSRELVATS
ncbi:MULTISPECIES: hypothetical protein [unclassified Streptomyces]|uniref:hypothetical protein n=1 Tax=unclassified Streptomyces TaxID=2593676 RepID=UPI0035E2C0D3